MAIVANGKEKTHLTKALAPADCRAMAAGDHWLFRFAAARQLKHLAVERDATIQALLAEALNDLFRKHGRLPIA